MKIFAATPEKMGPDRIAAHAERAERLGYDGLFVPDGLHDALLLAGQALAATRRITVSTSVLVVFPRSPMVTAVAAWDLHRMSGGRFELGMGSQIRQNIEDRYAAHWPSPPTSGLRDYVAALRAIFTAFQTGGKLRHEGPHYRLTRLQPFFYPEKLDTAPPQLMLGAVGPHMLELAGEIAEGLHTHPTNTSPRYLREAIRPRLAAGAARSGRDPATVAICANTLVATGRDQAKVAEERRRLRPMFAFLFSTPAYWPSLELIGCGDIGPRLQALTRAGRWDDMAEVISDKMLDEFIPTGTYADIAGVLAAQYGGLVERLIFPMPDDPADEERVRAILADLRRG